MIKIHKMILKIINYCKSLVNLDNLENKDIVVLDTLYLCELYNRLNNASDERIMRDYYGFLYLVSIDLPKYISYLHMVINSRELNKNISISFSNDLKVIIDLLKDINLYVHSTRIHGVPLYPSEEIKTKIEGNIVKIKNITANYIS